MCLKKDTDSLVFKKKSSFRIGLRCYSPRFVSPFRSRLSEIKAEWTQPASTEKGVQRSRSKVCEQTGLSSHVWCKKKWLFAGLNVAWQSLALENSGELECGRVGETVWSIRCRTAAPLLCDTRRTNLCQTDLTELHATRFLRTMGDGLLHCCGSGLHLVCYEVAQDFGIYHRLLDRGRRRRLLGCSLGSAGPLGHLCYQGGLSFYWPETWDSRREQPVPELGPSTKFLYQNRQFLTFMWKHLLK